MNRPASDAQAVLDSAIRTGKTHVRQIAVEDIRKFIETRPETLGPVTITQVRGSGEVGASSGIVLFSAAFDTGSGATERALVLRHAPGTENRLFFEYDLSRQFKVQKVLHGVGVPVPEPLWIDAAGDFFGVPGYIMVHVAGEAPNPSAFIKGPLANASAADRETMLDSVLQALANIHRLDYAAHGLGDFAMKAAGSSEMEKCINWYWQTWEWISLPNHARLISVHRWLLDNALPGGVTLTHGDATLHNYMFSGAKLTSVLDWEMSCLGRPENDLALQCVGNELFAAPPESGLLMPPAQAEWLARYERAGGRRLENLDYFKKLAVYMIIIAVQSLQRNMPPEVRGAQQPFVDRLWAMLES